MASSSTCPTLEGWTPSIARSTVPGSFRVPPAFRIISPNVRPAWRSKLLLLENSLRKTWLSGLVSTCFAVFSSARRKGKSVSGSTVKSAWVSWPVCTAWRINHSSWKVCDAASTLSLIAKKMKTFLKIFLSG